MKVRLKTQEELLASGYQERDSHFYGPINCVNPQMFDFKDAVFDLQEKYEERSHGFLLPNGGIWRWSQDMFMPVKESILTKVQAAYQIIQDTETQFDGHLVKVLSTGNLLIGTAEFHKDTVQLLTKWIEEIYGDENEQQ